MKKLIDSFENKDKIKFAGVMLLLAFMPQIITFLYFIGNYYAIFNMAFSPADILQYVSGVLVFVGTAYLSVTSLKQNEKLIEHSENNYNMQWKPFLQISEIKLFGGIAESNEEYKHEEYFTNCRFKEVIPCMEDNEKKYYSTIKVVLCNYAENAFLFNLEKVELTNGDSVGLFIKEYDAPIEYLIFQPIERKEKILLTLELLGNLLNNSSGESIKIKFLLKNGIGEEYEQEIRFRMDNILVEPVDLPSYTISELEYEIQKRKNVVWFI